MSSAKVFVLSLRAEFIFLENSWASFDEGGRVFCFFGGGVVLPVAETGFGRMGFSRVGSLNCYNY